MLWKTIVVVLIFLEWSKKLDLLLFNHVFFAKLLLMYLTFKFLEKHGHNRRLVFGVASVIVGYLMTIYWQIPYLCYQYLCYFYVFISIANASTFF